jgi:hypothetical protein
MLLKTMMQSMPETEVEVEDFHNYNHNYIREQIEQMPKFNQIEILRILTKYDEVTINENKYGIHINLREISNSILEEITGYIDYVNAQEIDLNTIEKEKEKYKNTFFLKDNKDKPTNISKNVS